MQFLLEFGANHISIPLDPESGADPKLDVFSVLTSAVVPTSPACGCLRGSPGTGGSEVGGWSPGKLITWTEVQRV